MAHNGIDPREYVAIVERSINAPIANHERFTPNTIIIHFMIMSLRIAGAFPHQSLKIYMKIFHNNTHPIAKLANVLLRFHNI